MHRNLIEPLVFASGISIFLFAHNYQLPLGSYLAPLPFWVMIGRPLGLFWNRNILKQLNKDVFPPDMKNYREMYLISKRALFYDVLFNHSIYNPLLAMVIIGYTYSARKMEMKVKGENGNVKPFTEVLKDIGVSLVKVRALVSLTSIMTEYWVSYFSLQKAKDGAMSISTSNKRILLVKQFLLSIGWHAYLLKKINENCI